MNLIYGVFAIVLTLAIMMNIMLKRPKDASTYLSVSLVWSIVGIPYLMMFIYMMYSNTADDLAIYSFHMATVAGLLWQFRVLEYKRRLAAIQVPIGIFIFVSSWVLMTNYVGMSKFAILLPSIIVMGALCLMLGTYFFMRSDSEVQLKTVIGMIYILMTLIKLLYIVDANNQSPIYFIGLFVMDFILYLMATVLIFLNAYYKNILHSSSQSKLIDGLLLNAEEPMAMLNSDGGVIFINESMKREIKEKDIEINNLQDIFFHYGPDQKAYWALEALKGFKEGESCLFPLDKSPESKNQRYFSCNVVKADNDDFKIVFQINTYPLSGFWSKGGRRTTDQRTRIEPSKAMMHVFDDKAIQLKGDQRMGFVMVRLTNYSRIEKKLGSELAGDYFTAVTSQLEQSEGIVSAARDREDTLLVLTDIDSYERVQKVVDYLVEKLSEPYKIGRMEISLSINIGVAIYPDNGITYGELYRRAQVALARNTSNDHEAVQYYEGSYRYLANDRDLLEGRLRAAVKSMELHILYQPQVEAHSQEFRGFEALLRWEKDGATIASPNVFIPLAEDIGMIEEIGSWVLEEAIRKSRLWQEEFGRTFIMSVNVSSRQLEQEDFIDQVAELLEKYQYSPECLELEITETRLLRSSKDVFKALKGLKKLGVKIALDDFGTGYSSLDYLRWLPFDVLKIDKSFIDHLNSDTIEKEIVHSVIGLVNKMNLETVAEGVENDEQLRSLQDSSCTYIQGYLYSKPLSEFEARETLLTIDG